MEGAVAQRPKEIRDHDFQGEQARRSGDDGVKGGAEDGAEHAARQLAGERNDPSPGLVIRAHRVDQLAGGDEVHDDTDHVHGSTQQADPENEAQQREHDKRETKDRCSGDHPDRRLSSKGRPPGFHFLRACRDL